jgi:hypothetical protein
MDEKCYTMDDYGLLVGLVSIPPRKEPTKFFEREFKINLCGNYLERRGNSEEMSNQLYQYRGYRIFDDHDLAVLTLIDDFAYPTRSFHPAHGNRKKPDDKYHNYEYQVMTCLNTLSNDISYSLEEFCKVEIGKYSFICITRAKVNNSFLLGNGIDFVEEIKSTLYERSSDYGLSEKTGKTLILDNLGYEELIVLNFSNQLSPIAEYVYTLRCMQFQELIHKEKRDQLLDRKIHFMVKKKGNMEEIEDRAAYNWEEAHIFSSVHALPGYQLDLPKDSPLLSPSLNEDLKVGIDFTWEIKPGHTKNFRKQFLSEIQPYITDQEAIDTDGLQLNNGLFVYTLHMTDSNCLNPNIDGNNLASFLHKLRGFDVQRNHTRKLHMKMVIHGKNEDKTNLLDKNCKEIDQKQHPEINIGDVLRIKSEKLNKLRFDMQQTNVSKLLRERIMKMFNNYNSSIADTLFFVNFIDLFEFMKKLLHEVEQYAKGNDPRSLQEFQKWLNDNIGNFEQAYYNRFHQSSRMREMTDFNIEWNGGIQQILSPLDTVYKELLCLRDRPQLDKFVQIIGEERVDVTDYTFRISVLQITYPELFIAMIWKEFFNFSWRGYLENDIGNRFAKENFSEYLKHYVQRDNGFQDNNAIHQQLADMIDKEFVNALIADTLSFGYGYNYDFELYSYWYWKVIFQGSSYRDKEQNLDSKYFVKFLTRILFIALVFEEKLGSVEDLRMNPPDPQIADLWITNFEDVLSFVRLLKKILVDELYFYKIFNLRIKLLQCDNLSDNIGFDCIKSMTEEQLDNLLKDRQDSFSRLTAQYIQNFENNQISFPGSHPKMFLVTFFYAFLQYMKDLDIYSLSGIRTQMLLRDKEGKPRKTLEMIANYSNILADPQGGLYCIKPTIMQKCFTSRSTFYRSIFDFCMTKKKEHVEYFYRTKEK